MKKIYLAIFIILICILGTWLFYKNHTTTDLSELDLNPSLKFSFSECKSDLNPYDPSQRGINETKWIGPNTLKIRAYVSINCAKKITDGDFILNGNKLQLKWNATECLGLCAKCVCGRELTYILNNLSKKDYDFSINTL